MVKSYIAKELVNDNEDNTQSVSKPRLPQIAPWISGPVGIGKTHLAVAVLAELFRVSKSTCYAYEINRCLYRIVGGIDYDETPLWVMSTMLRRVGMMVDVSKLWKANKRDVVFNTPFLILDDFPAAMPNEERLPKSLGELIYEIVDVRHREHRPTLITTNFTDDEITELLQDARVMDRMREMRGEYHVRAEAESWRGMR